MILRHLRSSWSSCFLAVVALAFVVAMDGSRIRRIRDVTAQPGWSAPASTLDDLSDTGYAAGRRQLIVPDVSGQSYEWIAQTQRMLKDHLWRIREVDYDNAPFGRETRLPALYRWWVGLVAWAIHLGSGQTVAHSVERAALYANPLLHLLLLAGSALWVARRVGTLPGGLVAVGAATLYPFSTSFLPGVLDHHALLLLCTLASVLPMTVAIRLSARPDASPPKGSPRPSFIVAGVAGGLGLWLDPQAQAMVLAGLVLSAATSILLVPSARPAGITAPLPWRSWALAGGLTVLLGYVFEYWPDPMLGPASMNHPLQACAWFGAGELLARMTSASRGTTPERRRGGWILAAVGGAVLVAAVAALLCTDHHELASGDPHRMQLTAANGGIAAPSLLAWLVRDGLSREAVATLLPLFLLAPAGGVLLERSSPDGQRAAIALALGPVLLTAAGAIAHLQLGSVADAALLGLISAGAPRGWKTRGRTAGLAFLGWTGVVAAGALIFPWPPDFETTVLTSGDMQAVIGRDLSHWLAERAGRPHPVVLAPPDLSTALCFHGGLRGVGSLAPENDSGVNAVLRIARSTTTREAEALVRSRGINFIVLPSWDRTLAELAHAGGAALEPAFISDLQRWILPAWLRPVPYTLPAITGFEDESVAVFEVIDEQDRETSLSRLAGYFIETRHLAEAASLRHPLQQYRMKFSARVTTAAIDFAVGDTAQFDRDLAAIESGLATRADKSLPWERRVELAIVLTQGKRYDLASAQVRQCAARIDEPELRALTPGALFRLLMLCRAARVDLPGARIRAAALRLLPPQLAQRVEGG